MMVPASPSGRQFVVIVAGGHGFLGTKMGRTDRDDAGPPAALIIQRHLTDSTEERK
jgi:hypothetical protein